MNAARPKRRHPSPPTPPISDNLIAPANTTRPRPNGTTSRTRRTLSASTREFLSQTAWRALFIALLVGGTPDGSLWANSKFLLCGLLLSALAACWIMPLDRRAPRAFGGFYRAWLELPLPLLACALLWLCGLVIATKNSVVSFLSIECSGSLLSFFLSAALLLGYAVRGAREEKHILFGLIALLDVAIAAAVVGLLSRAASWVVPAQLNAPIFAALFACALPLAWHQAAREEEVHNTAPRFKVLWSRGGAIYRRLRPGLMLGVVLGVGPSAAWLALFVAWMAHLVLRARRLSRTHGARPSLPFLCRPYLPTLFYGVLLCFFFVAWRPSQPLPQIVPDRSAVWAEVRNAVFERPLFGSGPGAFALRVPELGHIAASPNTAGTSNSWLRALVECGLVATLAALTACCLIGLHALAGFWRNDDVETAQAPTSRTQALLASSLAVVVATMLFDFPSAPVLAFFGVACLALLARPPMTPHQRAKVATSSLRLRIVKRAIVHSILLLLAVCLGVGTPQLWRATQAQKFYEQALQAGDVTVRFGWLLKARDRAPENAFYWAQLGRAKFQLDGPPAARAATNFFRQAAHRAPHDALWWHNLGALYLIANDYPQAIRNETRALEADPNWWLARDCLAHALEKQGELTRSREERKAAHALLSKYFGPGMGAAPAVTQAASSGRRYRLPSGDGDILMPPVVLADRDFFMVNSKQFQSGQ